MTPTPTPTPPLELYLVRHGQTELNARHVVQGGGIDEPLNETGRQQADALFRYYAETPFVGAYCSGLQRTRQTLEPFAQVGLLPTQLPGLNEISWGELEGRSASPELKRIFFETTQAWRNGLLDYKIPGGESPIEVWQRAETALQTVVDQHWATGGKVLICAHGRLLRIVLSQLLNYGLARMEEFEHRNTSVNHLLRKDQGYIALRLNDISHMTDRQVRQPQRSNP